MSICDSCTHEKVCALKELTRKAEEKLLSVYVPVGRDQVMTFENVKHLSIEMKCEFWKSNTPVNWRMKGRSPDLEEGVVK